MNAPAKPRYQSVPLSQPLSWDAWIKHIWENSPSRIFDAAERQAWVDAYWKANPRLEGPAMAPIGNQVSPHRRSRQNGGRRERHRSGRSHKRRGAIERVGD